jgi:hypothetical protein
LRRYDGWETRSRSNGGFDDPNGPLCVAWHHTAGSGETGASWGDAHYECEVAQDRPIANINIDPNPHGAGFSGVLMSVARTNTNGSGDSISFSRGTVPDDSLNSYAFGMEIANNGVGGPYSADQLAVAFIVSNTVNAYCHNQPTDVVTHQVWAPTRKVDPATNTACQGGWQPGSVTSSGSWDLDDLRQECARRAGTGPEPGPSPGPNPPIPKGDDQMLRAAKNQDSGNAYYVGDGDTATWVGGDDAKESALIVAGGVIDVSTEKVVYRWADVKAIPQKQVKKYVGNNPNFG